MMKALQTTTIAQLDARLREQVLEVASLRLALDIQGSRITRMKAKPRPKHPSADNGNGRRDR